MRTYDGKAWLSLAMSTYDPEGNVSAAEVENVSRLQWSRAQARETTKILNDPNHSAHGC